VPQKASSRPRVSAWPAILLAWVAGFVDAVGYLTLFKLFTAHMSGNSAALGAYLGQGHWSEAFHRAFPIPLFVMGVALGAGMTETAVRRGVRSPFSVALAFEAALLALFMLLGNRALRAGTLRQDMGWVLYPLTSLPALAMGLQSATLRRVGSEQVRTTYITGMLTDMAESGVKYLFWLAAAARGRGLDGFLGALRRSSEQTSWFETVLYGGIWSAFIAGAALGGYMLGIWRLWALSLPLAGLAIVITQDLICPLGLPPDLS
jgi:uncharacterized membrane protein YoaK (UPF0700 family)